MKWLNIRLALFFMLMFVVKLQAQGPPITTDKPIMLGSKSIILKTLTEIRKTERGTFTRIPIMAHYLITSNSLVAVHLPMVFYNFSNSNLGSGQTLGDIEILGKYQFFRKDNTGKTFRIVAKTLQILPTGKKLGIDGISTKIYQSYQGVVAGYESIKYGISNEIGYNFVPDSNTDEIRHKLGIGLPLLKPSYPVNQINLYFEYQNTWFSETDEFVMLYAQGVQYAKGRLTLEAAVQLPLIQNISVQDKREYSVFLGTRYVF